MDEGIIAIAIVGIIFVAMPAVLFHYATEWRKAKTVSADDERLIDDLWRTAQRLERRVDALETILDREAPNWRDEHRERPHA